MRLRLNSTRSRADKIAGGANGSARPCESDGVKNEKRREAASESSTRRDHEDAGARHTIISNDIGIKK